MTSHNALSFIDFLTIQRLSPRTEESYLRAVRELGEYHKQSPATLSNEQIQDFLLYCIQEKKLEGVVKLQCSLLRLKKVFP